MVQAAAAVGGVMVWGIFSWHTLGPLVQGIDHCLNTTAYVLLLTIPLTAMYPSPDGYFQQDNAPCQNGQIVSKRFLDHDNEFATLQWPPQSPDLNPIKSH